MFRIWKKACLILVLVLFLAAPVLACMLPAKTTVWGFVGPGGGMSKMSVIRDMPITMHPDQPSAEMLASFNNNPSVVENWSDGKVVTDPNGVNYLVHENNIICE